MKDFLPQYKPEQGRLSWVEYWGYDLQGAVYQEIVRQNTGKRLGKKTNENVGYSANQGGSAPAQTSSQSYVSDTVSAPTLDEMAEDEDLPF